MQLVNHLRPRCLTENKFPFQMADEAKKLALGPSAALGGARRRQLGRGGARRRQLGRGVALNGDVAPVKVDLRGVGVCVRKTVRERRAHEQRGPHTHKKWMF